MRTNTCLTCAATFTRPKNPNREYKYCSIKCSGADPAKRARHSTAMTGRTAWNKGIRGRQPWHNTTGLTTSEPWNKGKKGIYDAETLKRISAARIGIPPPNKGCTMSDAQRAKLRAAKLGKVGSASNAWKGGRTAKHTLIRSSAESKAWKRAVLERDRFTCQLCQRRGGRLHVDHIKPFAYFPELRFDLTNGRTLCIPCHQSTDTYGGKAFRHRPGNNS